MTIRGSVDSDLCDVENTSMVAVASGSTPTVWPIPKSTRNVFGGSQSAARRGSERVGYG